MPVLPVASEGLADRAGAYQGREDGGMTITVTITYEDVELLNGASADDAVRLLKRAVGNFAPIGQIGNEHERCIYVDSLVVEAGLA